MLPYGQLFQGLQLLAATVRPFGPNNWAHRAKPKMLKPFEIFCGNQVGKFWEIHLENFAEISLQKFAKICLKFFSNRLNQCTVYNCLPLHLSWMTLEIKISETHCKGKEQTLEASRRQTGPCNVMGLFKRLLGIVLT